MMRRAHPLLLIPMAFLLAGVVQSCGSSKAANGSSISHSSAVRSEYADELNVPPAELDRIELYRKVDEWRGTPYSYGGQSKNGVDCSGFIGQIYRDVYGENLPRQVEAIYQACDERFRRKAKLQEGDLVFFDIKGAKASHAGIYLQNGHFAHASSSSGVVISKLSNPYYRKHFYRGGRME